MLNLEAGERAQQLRALAALVEDSGPAPGTHATACSQLEFQRVSFCPPWAVHTHGVQTHAGKTLAQIKYAKALIQKKKQL